MLASMSSKAIMTKAKALYGKRLTAEQYKEMTHKKSVAEIAEFLRDETSYGEALASIQPTAIHRGQLETMLYKVRFERYLRLIRFSFQSGDNYYAYLIVDFEIDQILQMVRLLNAGAAEDYITQYPQYLQKWMSFKMMDLARVRSFDDLMQVLRGSPYHGVLMPLRPKSGERIDYTACEFALKNYFYQHVENVIRQTFHGDTRRELLRIFDTMIELVNIVTIYRLKKYFPDSTPDYIRSCVVPHPNLVPEKVLRALIAAPTADDFIRMMAESPYARFLGSRDYSYIEETTARVSYHLNKRYLRFATAAPTAFTAYMVLSEFELSNITSIIEGVRYNVPAAELEKLLIL